MVVTTRIRSSQLPDGTAFDLYLPDTHDGSRALPILVSVLPVHPSVPRYAALELFDEFADANDYLIIAPRFDITSGFQTLGVGTSDRYDARLLQMVEHVGKAHSTDPAQFDMFGYSAGGQFAHRFMYFFRDRLRAVAVGAPGTVTLPDTREAWPAGLADVTTPDGHSCNLSGDHWPRILLIVGDADITSENLQQSEVANRFGSTRLERARTLHYAWQSSGIPHDYVEVPGMAHSSPETSDLLKPHLRQFFRDRTLAQSAQG